MHGWCAASSSALAGTTSHEQDRDQRVEEECSDFGGRIGGDRFGLHDRGRNSGLGRPLPHHLAFLAGLINVANPAFL